MRSVLDRLIRVGTDRPKWTLAVATVLALICAGVALTLQPNANVNTLVSSSNADYQATQKDASEFGGAAVVVLVRQPLTRLLGASDIHRLSALEACLDGNEVATEQIDGIDIADVPVAANKAQPYGGTGSACGHLMKSQPADVVYGPATFLNQAILAVVRQAITLAQTSGGQAELQKLQAELGISGFPTIGNTEFLQTIVFDGTRGNNVPKARFNYLFPSKSSALIQVRLKPNLSSAQTAQAIKWIRQATQMPLFKLSDGGSYLVSGEPVVLNDVSSALSGQVALLLIGAVLVMGVVLTLIFRRRLRLLPLVLALAAAAITFGLCALAGGSLTMASIAVLPILIGLAVDYGIQFQSRASGPTTIFAAALSTATGFLVLLLSPVPMVRGFGLLLVIGVGVAFVVVLCAGSAALGLGGLSRTPRPAGARRRRRRLAIPGGSALVASLRGAGQIVVDLARPLGRVRVGSPLRRLDTVTPLGRVNVDRALTRISGRPRTVLVVGLVLAVAGWALDTQTPIQSDITKLVPSNLAALKDLNTLEKVSGTSGEVDVLVHADNVATPAVLRWMISYQAEITSHFGYVEEKGCAAATVCPALSLLDLFTSGTTSPANLTQAQINGLLGAIPTYFSQAALTTNHQYASLAFGIRLMPLAKQVKVIEYMRSHLHPPAGVTAQMAGLPVLAADADGSLSSSSRRMLTLLAGLVAVGLVLALLFRDRRRALVPLAPIVLATGWSALIVWAIGIPLNPMSATLGALVIAISTEFSVLLSERYRRERQSGSDGHRALLAAYRSTGVAVLCSGITAIAGFGVLIVSDVTMLRDFGLVTLIDMSVSLLGVLVVLPAVLAVVDRQAAAAPQPSETVVV